MSRFGGQAVEIRLSGNINNEAVTFADALETALLRANMYVTRNVFTQDPDDDDRSSPSGVSFLVGKNLLSKDSATNSLALLLMSQKVVDGLIRTFPSNSNENPNYFVILVTETND